MKTVTTGTKFTKGEWEVSTCGSNVSVWSGNESIINAMTFKYPMIHDRERVISNAHLIAAAPNMYKELNDLIPILEYLDPLTHPNIELDCLVDVIKDVLAKARGE